MKVMSSLSYLHVINFYALFLFFLHMYFLIIEPYIHVIHVTAVICIYMYLYIYIITTTLFG